MVWIAIRDERRYGKYLKLTSLSLLACLLLELFELFFVLSLDFKFHLSKLNLVFILGSSNLFLEQSTLIAPLVKLEIIHNVLLVDVLVSIDVLSDFIDADMAGLKFLSCLLAKLMNCVFHILHGFISELFVLLLVVEQLVPQSQ